MEACIIYDLCRDVYNIENRFCFSDNIPTVPEIVKLITKLDISKSSCVKDINSRLCKEAMLSIPHVICSLCCKSMTTGVIPKPLVEGTISLLPKDWA